MTEGTRILPQRSAAGCCLHRSTRKPNTAGRALKSSSRLSLFPRSTRWVHTPEPSLPNAQQSPAPSTLGRPPILSRRCCVRRDQLCRQRWRRSAEITGMADAQKTAYSQHLGDVAPGHPTPPSGTPQALRPKSRLKGSFVPEHSALAPRRKPQARFAEPAAAGPARSPRARPDSASGTQRPPLALLPPQIQCFPILYSTPFTGDPGKTFSR